MIPIFFFFKIRFYFFVWSIFDFFCGHSTFSTFRRQQKTLASCPFSVVIEWIGFFRHAQSLTVVFVVVVCSVSSSLVMYFLCMWSVGLCSGPSGFTIFAIHQCRPSCCRDFVLRLLLRRDHALLAFSPLPHCPLAALLWPTCRDMLPLTFSHPLVRRLLLQPPLALVAFSVAFSHRLVRRFLLRLLLLLDGFDRWPPGFHIKASSGNGCFVMSPFWNGPRIPRDHHREKEKKRKLSPKKGKKREILGGPAEGPEALGGRRKMAVTTYFCRHLLCTSCRIVLLFQVSLVALTLLHVLYEMPGPDYLLRKSRFVWTCVSTSWWTK